MANKKNVRSQKMIANDRKNLLLNAEKFIRQARRLELKLEKLKGDPEELQHYSGELIWLVDKCSRTLKKYLNPKDGLLLEVDHEWQGGMDKPEISESEQVWLSRVDDSAIQLVEDCKDKTVELSSTDDLLNQILVFRRSLGELTDEISNEPNQDKVLYLSNDVRKMTIGLGLICSDGLAYYFSPEPSFFAGSIWLGAGIFLYGANNLLGEK